MNSDLSACRSSETWYRYGGDFDESGMERSSASTRAADTGGMLKVTRYPFRTPDTGERVPAEASDFYDADGGLFVARLDGFEARAILPPTVRDLAGPTVRAVQRATATSSANSGRRDALR